MSSEKPVRRLTLRQLLNQAEKCTANLIENCRTQFLQASTEFRGLSRPVRRRSQFPTLVALLNSLKKFEQASDSLLSIANYLHEHLETIREHANRERANRV